MSKITKHILYTSIDILFQLFKLMIIVVFLVVFEFSWECHQNTSSRS